MSNLRATHSKSIERDSLKITLRLVSKQGDVLDEQVAWQALIDCFLKHPSLDVFQAEISPDKDEL
jgi:hypothetical protein